MKQWEELNVTPPRQAFSSPEAVLLLVSTKNHYLWAGSTPEVCNSWTSLQIWQIWLAENTKQILCVCSKNQFRPVVMILGADQKKRSLWGQKCQKEGYTITFLHFSVSICDTEWRETQWKKSVLPTNKAASPRPGFILNSLKRILSFL